MAPPPLLAWLALPACLLASSPPGARLVHLGPGLTEPTHALLRGQFFPDAPDNPHRKHFRYTLDVWAWVETVLGLGQSIAAVGPAGELLGVCLARDLARPGPPASPGQPWPPRPGQGELVTIAGPFLEGDVASPTPRQQGLAERWHVWLTARVLLPVSSWVLGSAPALLRPLLPPSLTPYTQPAPPVQATTVAGYSQEKHMERLNCSRLMYLSILSVAREARGQGLATRLTREAERLAASRGCDCLSAWGVNMYSIRIFEKLGWSRQEQLRFDDFKDPVTGEKYIPSDIHGNHTEMVSFAKKIRPIPT